MKNENMIKNARRIDKICKILQVLALAGIAVGIIAGVLSVVFIGRIDGARFNTLSIGSMSLFLSDGYPPQVASLLPALLCTFLAPITVCLFCRYGIKVLRQILAPMQQGLPFDEKNPDLCRKLGWTVILGSLVTSLVGSVAEYLMVKACILPLADGSAIERTSYSFQLPSAGLVAGVLILFLAYVFRYGAELQRESDETL